MSEEVLLEVKDLKMYFENRKGLLGKQIEYVKAVDGVSFTINKGETIGLVGESGCGKNPPPATPSCAFTSPLSGQILYKGVGPCAHEPPRRYGLPEEHADDLPGPLRLLNPRMTVADIIGEPIDIYHLYEGKRGRSESLSCSPPWPWQRPRQPLSPRVFRRTAPESGNRPRPGREPGVHRLRRAHLGPGRVHPGPGGEHVGGLYRRAWG